MTIKSGWWWLSECGWWVKEGKRRRARDRAGHEGILSYIPPQPSLGDIESHIGERWKLAAVSRWT